MEHVYALTLVMYEPDGSVKTDWFKGIFSSYENAVAAIKDHSPYSQCISEASDDVHMYSTDIECVNYVIFRHDLNVYRLT
jgi:hypothetical protein